MDKVYNVNWTEFFGLSSLTSTQYELTRAGAFRGHKKLASGRNNGRFREFKARKLKKKRS